VPITDPVEHDRLTLYGSFTSSSSYKPMLYLALARVPFSFRTVNLKIGVQKEADYLAINRWGVVPTLRHHGLTILQSNVILDYLARTTGHFEGKTEQQKWEAREWLSWEADHITAVARIRHSARFRKDARRGHRRIPPPRRGRPHLCRQHPEGPPLAHRR
jgi:glutathione S-transferase